VVVTNASQFRRVQVEGLLVFSDHDNYYIHQPFRSYTGDNTGLLGFFTYLVYLVPLAGLHAWENLTGLTG